MAHYAKVKDGIVTQVIVAEADYFETFVDNSPGEWVQTSYNTYGGVHTDGGTPLRKNYAGIGFHYDGTGFYQPQPYPSWTLNSKSYIWEAPVAHPNDGEFYIWDESAKGWQKVDD
mgnify:CR=1 FL=1